MTDKDNPTCACSGSTNTVRRTIVTRVKKFTVSIVIAFLSAGAGAGYVALDGDDDCEVNTDWNDD